MLRLTSPLLAEPYKSKSELKNEATFDRNMAAKSAAWDHNIKLLRRCPSSQAPDRHPARMHACISQISRVHSIPTNTITI